MSNQSSDNKSDIDELDLSSVIDNMKDAYPRKIGVKGYKPYMVFSILSVMTYVISLNTFTPHVIGDMMYVLGILAILPLGVAHFRTEDSDIPNMTIYYASCILGTLISYFAYIQLSQLVVVLSETFSTLPLGLGSITSLVFSSLEVMVGIPATAFFYYSIYIYYEIIIESTMAIESEKNGD